MIIEVVIHKCRFKFAEMILAWLMLIEVNAEVMIIWSIGSLIDPLVVGWLNFDWSIDADWCWLKWLKKWWLFDRMFDWIIDWLIS